MYTLIITETREQADAINAALPPATRDIKVEAFAYGYLFCGQTHACKRPGAVISLVNIPEDDEWLCQILRPAMAHDAIWVLP